MLEVFLRKDVEFGIELKKMTLRLNKAHRHRIPPEFLKIRRLSGKGELWGND